eukprot:gene33741-43603_t
MKAQTNYSDAAVSTIVEHLTKTILPLSMTLANLYEEAASTHYSETSAENRKRVKHDFIRTKCVNWKDGEVHLYQGVFLFPVVCTNILKTVFRLPKAQIQAMDASNDMDNSPKWDKVFTCLLIHLGFGELSNPSQTLAGKIYKMKSMKAEEQKVRDEEEAGIFKDPVKQAEWDEDTENIEAFGGKRSLTTAQKREAKRKATAEEAASSSQVDRVVQYLTSAGRREEQVKLERERDREHRERMWRIIAQSSSTSSSQQQHPMLMPTIPVAKFCSSCGHALTPPPCLL